MMCKRSSVIVRSRDPGSDIKAWCLLMPVFLCTYKSSRAGPLMIHNIGMTTATYRPASADSRVHTTICSTSTTKLRFHLLHEVGRTKLVSIRCTKSGSVGASLQQETGCWKITSVVNHMLALNSLSIRCTKSGSVGPSLQQETGCSKIISAVASTIPNMVLEYCSAQTAR